MLKTVLLKRSGREATPQREPMGLCFSAPKQLTCWAHFSQATSVPDVSSLPCGPPSAIVRSISDSKGGNLPKNYLRSQSAGGLDIKIVAL